VLSVSADAPMLVYVHGGYWQELSRDISAYCVVPQYKSGIRVSIVGYDLAPTGHFLLPLLMFFFTGINVQNFIFVLTT
jgi:acetyl esterase/lipase